MKNKKNKIKKNLKKRFLINSKNNIKYKKSNTKHLLTKKSKKRKMHLKKLKNINKNNFNKIFKLIKK